MIAAQDQVDIGGDLLLRRSKPNQLIRLVANLCPILSTNRANFPLPPLSSYPHGRSARSHIADYSSLKAFIYQLFVPENFAALSHRKLPDAEYGVDWSLGPGGKSVARGGKNWPLFRAAAGAVAYAVVCRVGRDLVSI